MARAAVLFTLALFFGAACGPAKEQVTLAEWGVLGCDAIDAMDEPIPDPSRYVSLDGRNMGSVCLLLRQHYSNISV